jgi:hypothetical protein
MSATFNEDVQTLKELVLHNPVSGASGTETQVSELVDPSQETSGACGGTIFVRYVFPNS